MRILPPYRGRREPASETPDHRRWIFSGLGSALAPMHLDVNVFFDPERLRALLLRDGARTEARITRRFDQWIMSFGTLRIVAGERNASFVDTRGGGERTGYCQVLPFPTSLPWA